MLPTDAMNLVMIMEHAARFGMAAQVENLAPLRDYATSLLKGNRPSQDCSGKVISNTRFVVLEPGQVKPEVLEVVQQALLDDGLIGASDGGTVRTRLNATQAVAYPTHPVSCHLTMETQL